MKRKAQQFTCKVKGMFKLASFVCAKRIGTFPSEKTKQASVAHSVSGDKPLYRLTYANPVNDLLS